MYPNFDMLISVSANHLPANFHIAIGVGQLREGLDNFDFLGPPNFGFGYDGLDVDFVCIYMVDAFVVLVIEKHPANINIRLLHPGLERFNFHRVLNINYVLVGVLRRQLISKRVWMVRNRLPIFSQQNWDPWRDVIPHSIILF